MRSFCLLASAINAARLSARSGSTGIMHPKSSTNPVFPVYARFLLTGFVLISHLVCGLALCINMNVFAMLAQNAATHNIGANVSPGQIPALPNNACDWLLFAGGFTVLR